MTTQVLWPMRWDLLFRYRIIEIVAQWEGRLTTNHLCSSLGIGGVCQGSWNVNHAASNVFSC